MTGLHDVSYFFGGAFLSNGVPHFVSGVMGRPFQSPFAKPPGRGLSSSTVNVLWGFGNFVMAYLLIARVGHFDARADDKAIAVGAGVLLMGVMAARLFGRFHGGHLENGADVIVPTTGSIRDLKGAIPRPDTPVSLDDMRAAIDN
jgi:hypothetical protein